MKRPALQNERVAALRWLFGRISGDTLFVSSKRTRLEARNFAVIFIFIPFTTCEKISLQNKQVVILRMAFRARKVLGTFEKRAPGPNCSRHGSANQGSLSKKKSTGCDISQPMVSSNHASSNRPELKFTNSLLCFSH